MAAAVATRVPEADVIALIASIAGTTQADTLKVIQAIGPAFVQTLVKPGLQEIELGGFLVIEEYIRKGTLPAELGGIAYNVHALSTRISDKIKALIKTKANKLVGGVSEPLTDEEYQYALRQVEAA